MRGLKKTVWACFVISTLSAAVWAEEEKKNDSPDAKPVVKATASDIALWIKEFDADKFAARQAASEKLFAAGTAAIPALTNAADSSNPGISTLSINLLQRFYELEDKNLKNAAEAALKKITQSDNLSIARRAFQALNPEEGPKQENLVEIDPEGNLHVPGSIGFSLKSYRGIQKLEVTEFDRKVVVERHPDASIKMEITEYINGKNLTHTFEAKDSGLLKLKSPEAYEIYMKYFSSEAQERWNKGFGFNGPGALSPRENAFAGNPPAANPQGDPRATPPPLNNASRRQEPDSRWEKNIQRNSAEPLIEFNNELKYSLQVSEKRGEELTSKEWSELKAERKKDIKEHRKLLQEIEKNLDTLEQQLENPAPPKTKNQKNNPRAMPPSFGNASRRQESDSRWENYLQRISAEPLIKFNNQSKYYLDMYEKLGAELTSQEFSELKAERKKDIKEYRKLLKEIKKNLDTLEQQLDNLAPKKNKNQKNKSPAKMPEKTKE